MLQPPDANTNNNNLKEQRREEEEEERARPREFRNAAARPIVDCNRSTDQCLWSGLDCRPNASFQSTNLLAATAQLRTHAMSEQEAMRRTVL
jgi:hypothetical protein